MSAAVRHHVTVHGLPEGQPMLFAHGFGCDQNMWRHVWPAFATTHRIVLFDHIGMGRSDTTAFDPDRYVTLHGYAQDVLDICTELDLEDVVFVGHSVSAMIGALAAISQPDRFKRLILIGPSPRYVDDGEYVGGFSSRDIDELLETMDGNYLGWAAAMAPVIMGNPDRPALSDELTNLFCQADPAIARHFAGVTFRSDNRADLPHVTTPALVLQSREDAIAPLQVGDYVHRHLPRSKLVVLDAVGHCPNLSAPDSTVAAMRDYLAA